MTNTWHECKNILIIRPDNMGDIIMMTPALRALKETFGCRITMLTSQMGSLITPYINAIDETIITDLPWVKTNQPANAQGCSEIIEKIKSYGFDGAIISTVYSQNPLPAAMIAYMAGIPRRLAYCRENPYELLTDWLPDKEPFEFINHQVSRELSLVKFIGTQITNDKLSLRVDNDCRRSVIEKLTCAGVDIARPWFIIHPAVSEKKREYPAYLWRETVKLLQKKTGFQILITGSSNDKRLVEKIIESTHGGIFSVAGLLSIGEFIAAIERARIVISVNTATVHIASALNKPVVVLYALTNPQHTPWKVPSAIIPFNVPLHHQSKNEVVQYVQRKYYGEKTIHYPSPEKITQSSMMLLSEQKHLNKEAALLQ